MYPGNGQRAIYHLPGTRLLRKYLSVLLTRETRLSELMRSNWPDRKQRKAQVSALELDAFTYAAMLDWAPCLEPSVEDAIPKCPFLEYPARRLYAILQIEQTFEQGWQRNEALNLHGCLCGYHEDLSVTNPTLETHGHMPAQNQQRMNRTLLQLRHAASGPSLLGILQALGN